MQDARKNAGLDVADRIDLTLGVPADHLDWVKAHEVLIAGETLAVSVRVNPSSGKELEINVTKHV